jgi:photosystem II stability/assembly factor-like uncharacterized protein
MKTPLITLLSILAPAGLFAQTWTPQNSGTMASLRGISVVNAKVVWASGSGGTWVRTTDGGATWQTGTVEGAQALDFRGVRAIDSDNAYLLSSGTGEQSRVYKTNNGGQSWRLQFTNPDAKGFFDAIAFWDARHGMIAGDPIDGQITVFTTDDGGENWARQRTVASLPQEGTFAASNSCLTIREGGEAWIATGGLSGSRVLHSKDNGRSWTAAITPMRHDGAGAGAFSLAFADSMHGMALGGDYSKDKEKDGNIAITADGGRTWTAPSPSSPNQSSPNGYRSAVLYVADQNLWLAVGTSGSDFSRDGGNTWTSLGPTAYNALSGAPAGAVSGAKSDAVWAAGGRGRIAKLSVAPNSPSVAR